MLLIIIIIKQYKNEFKIEKNEEEEEDLINLILFSQLN